MRILKYTEIKQIREEILAKQKGICPICKRPISTPCLDHQHRKKLKGSGRIRGVLCHTCNAYLGKIENNAHRYKIRQDEISVILRNMADYLEQEHLPYIHPTEAPKPKRLKKNSYKKLVKKLKEIGFKKKIPEYPKSQKLTKPLKELFDLVGLTPEFYKDRR